MPVAAHERHAQEVEEAAQVALRPVARASVLARAVVHGDLGDAEAAVRREHGMKRCSSPYRRIPCSTSARYALRPQFTSCSRTPETTAVAQLKTAREQPPQERVVAPRLPAGDEVEALVELGEELRDLRRIVLEVGVDRHDDVSARLEEAGLQRRRLAEVAPEVDDDDVRRLVVEPRQHRQAPVRRAVVDEDHLERLVARLERRGDLARSSSSSERSSLSSGTTTEITSRRVSASQARILQRVGLDVDLEPVVGELVLVRRRQLARTVRDEEPLRVRRLERVDRLVEREVPARLAVELTAQERRLADEEIGVARRLRPARPTAPSRPSRRAPRRSTGRGTRTSEACSAGRGSG